MENLVFLPGWTKDGNSYKKLTKSAPANFKIFIPSYDYLSPDKGLDYFDNQLLIFLKDNNLKKVHLSGHSFGGTLAVYFASKHPEKLNNLYLIDAEVFPEGFSEVASRFLKEHLKRSLYLNWLSFVGLFKKPMKNFKLAVSAIGLNLKKEVEGIKVPTFLIWAENDNITPVSEAKKIQKLIPGSKLIKLESADHDWILYNPEYLWKNIVF